MDDEEIIYSDDLAPTDSTFLNVQDEEQERANSRERAMVQAAKPMYDEILSWFDTEIRDLDSIDHLRPDSRLPMEAQVLGLQHAKAKLTIMKGVLTAMRDEYLKN